MSEYDILAENEGLPENHRSGYVAIVGRPNAGKSTLLNAFMRQKIAIVTPRPQTTRIRQLGIITEPDHQIVFVDTPGILLQPRHKLDEFMAETVIDAFQDADVILWLVDASTLPGPDDRDLAAKLATVAGHIPVIIGMNKVDLLTPDKVIPTSEAYCALLPDAAWLLFSAEKGQGLEELYGMLLERLPLGPRYYPEDQITDVFVRNIAAEMVREQVMLQLREEIPYGVAVLVDEYKERDNGVTYIKATIYTERDSHKRIIIGKNGTQLQRLGAAARKAIEQMLESPVYLDLWVKVEPKWRQNERILDRFGYSKPS
ncbi:MAG: GTPase Era [Anaerolineales bacterium]|nr:GTPase Era [Anaerolineales bacterium]